MSDFPESDENKPDELSDHFSERDFSGDDDLDWQLERGREADWQSDLDESQEPQPLIDEHLPEPPAEDWQGLDPKKIIQLLEAAIFAYGKPMNLERILQLFPEGESKPSRAALRWSLKELASHYKGRGIELVTVGSGYRFQTISELGVDIQRLWEEKPQKYSRATLETLALIAYRQPITRSEIEEVRGVSVSSQIVRAMLEREWVRVVGHRDVPGRPALYATTKGFLDYFGLTSLEELPTLAEIQDLDALEPEFAFGTGNDEPGKENDSKDSSGKEASFSSLVASLKANEPENDLDKLDDELAEDLNKTSDANTQFENMLKAEREQREKDVSDHHAESELSSDTDNGSEASNKKDQLNQLSDSALTQDEKLQIIQKKLAEQQALLEKRDSDEENG